MSKLRKRGELIHQFILNNVEEYPDSVTTLTAHEFDITRQAVNKHIQLLIKQKSLKAYGSTRNRKYELYPQTEWIKKYDLKQNLAEDIVWDVDIKSQVADLPENVRDIWYYGFTEIFNNAIEHSSGEAVTVYLARTAVDTSIIISDGGEGIFKEFREG